MLNMERSAEILIITVSLCRLAVSFT